MVIHDEIHISWRGRSAGDMEFMFGPVGNITLGTSAPETAQRHQKTPKIPTSIKKKIPPRQIAREPSSLLPSEALEFVPLRVPSFDFCAFPPKPRKDAHRHPLPRPPLPLPPTSLGRLARHYRAPRLRRLIPSPPQGVYLRGFWNNDLGESFPVDVYPGCRDPGVPSVSSFCVSRTSEFFRAHFITTWGQKRCFFRHQYTAWGDCYVGNVNNCNTVLDRWNEVDCWW
ncbi:hypothetical protein B0T16DRAFT_191855 [Cercophora newfieldiana]|uniref:Uncharacterized protein n=1 Tax=Cercophora newfieldiana TaxID=92897 RepID=A0AA39Y101_9PEZI|nr:hypothetical protein B0T16DRAFT_191855 [Cercophora newfieldiana]